jgi:septation ring formation regulator EzrA
LTRLRAEKEQVTAQYQNEKEGLQSFERELDELRSQSDYLNGVIQEKEEAVAEFNKMIEESEKAYTRVVPL